MALVDLLFAGPIDIVGDVHGELDALHALTKSLGYKPTGEHPEGRRLVFLGDLCDRGPDSPGVIEYVETLVERDLAQCILGNHELNILRGDPKAGNRWFIDPAHEEMRGEFRDSKPARDPSAKHRWSAFFVSLPVALERADLRVTHAAWHAPSLADLRAKTESAIDLFKFREAACDVELQPVKAAARREKQEYGDALYDRNATVPFLPSVASYDVQKQTGNPVRVVTSGLERAADEPFWASGQWRMSDRVQWWNEYTDAPHVIFGHYWRGTGGDLSGGKPDFFANTPANAWSGPQRNAFCVDFSVGGRYHERQVGKTSSFVTRLAAVRWPERTLYFDDGSTVDMIEPR